MNIKPSTLPAKIPRPVAVFIVAGLLLFAGVSDVHAENRKRPSTASGIRTDTGRASGKSTPPQGQSAEQDRRALQVFPKVNDTAKSASKVVDRIARDHAEQSARAASGNRATITSRDRSASSRIASPAHDRGAVDVVTPNMKKDATTTSKLVGKGFTVIHEQPKASVSTTGQPRDKHSIYSDGKLVKETTTPPRATGEHLHIQPDFNKRLHQAVNTPSTTPERAINTSQTSKPKSETGTPAKTPKAGVK